MAFFFGGFPHCVRVATSAVPLSLQIKNMDEQTIFLIVQIAP